MKRIISTLSLLGILARSAISHATPDAYGVGNGHDGALNVAMPNTTLNRYTTITANVMAGANTVTVGAVAGITPGTLVMIWQAKNGTSVSGSATPVDTATLNVGQYEIVRVIGVMGTTLTLERALSNGYFAVGAQVITVPEYTTVTVAAAGSIIATPWNGSVGGVVAFLVNGTFTVAGAVRADASGFRGGLRSRDVCNGACMCGVNDVATLDDATCAEGGRGEGFDTSVPAFGAMGCGTGNRGIGGGGGGHINAGGAGGAHIGVGGHGGAAWCSGGNTGGLPGARVVVTPLDNALVMGGGGGGGQQNNTAATDGAAGGGLIFVRATTLAGVGTISARGGNSAVAGIDGAGGGGAGGSVYLRAISAMTCPVVDVSGGNGAGAAMTHGGGGGGGAGHVRFDGAPMGCAPRAAGGTGDMAHPFAQPGGAGAVDPPAVFGCMSNANCAGATPICDMTLRVCRPCDPMRVAMDCAAPTPQCAIAGPNTGRCVLCNVAADCARGLVCDAMSNTCVDTDTDGDTIPDRIERGCVMNVPCVMGDRDTDNDGTPDYQDTDDDGDGVLTSVELGMGGFNNPRNTDAMVPMGEGSADLLPDYLDPDDDGDGIPTRTENNLEAMGGAPDMDGVPAYLDRDSDGDSIPDAIEAGPDASNPRNTDAADRPDFLDTDSDNDTVTDRVEVGGNPLVPANTDMDALPDYRDTDSDNDCALDSLAVEAGGARTDATLPNRDPNANCSGATPRCNVMLGLCVSDLDSDGDGVPDMVERRLMTDPMNPDSDGDGVPDGSEIGAGPMFVARDTDMDGNIDALDTDDDGDGVPTRMELGPGGFMNAQNSDAMVPMGEGSADMVPDYLDPDDDGDGIPTRTENNLEAMGGAPDMDGVPAYLDRDSDGDSVPDSVEAGADPTMPANTDGTDRPDFLDQDSDNDCARDSDMREMGAARIDPTMPNRNQSANCTDPSAPVCEVMTGVCVPAMINGDASTDASADAASIEDVNTDVATTDSGSMATDAIVADRGDASSINTMDAGRDANGSNDANGDGSTAGVVSGDGACACRIPAIPAKNSRSPWSSSALALLAIATVCASRRRREHSASSAVRS